MDAPSCIHSFLYSVQAESLKYAAQVGALGDMDKDYITSG